MITAKPLRHVLQNPGIRGAPRPQQLVNFDKKDVRHHHQLRGALEVSSQGFAPRQSRDFGLRAQTVRADADIVDVEFAI